MKSQRYLYLLLLTISFLGIYLLPSSVAFSAENNLHAAMRNGEMNFKTTLLMPATATPPVDSNEADGKFILLSLPVVAGDYLQSIDSDINQTNNFSPEPDMGSDDWITIVTENCDDGNLNGWRLGDGSDDGKEYLWGCDDFRSQDGGMSAWPARSGANGIDPAANNYPNDMYSWIVYGPFDLSNAIDAEIKFDLWRRIESGYDFVFAGMSTDGIHFSGYYYDGNRSWEQERPNFSSFAGNSQVWVAFIFSSDSSITDAGPWIDNIQIRKKVDLSSRFIWKHEAENAQLSQPIGVATDQNASESRYIYTTNAWSDGSARFDFTVPYSGDYFIWARAMGFGWHTNSWRVSVDGASPFHYEVPMTTGQWDWGWSIVHDENFPESPFSLSAGYHSVRFISREDRTRLDAILITNDSSYIPPNTIEAHQYLPILSTQPPFFCDIYEPNNVRYHPWRTLALDQTIHAKLCSGDKEDNYALYVPQPGIVKIHIQIPQSLVNYATVWLYSETNLNSSATLCGEAPIRSASHVEQCNISASGNYVIRLYAKDRKSDDLHDYVMWATR